MRKKEVLNALIEQNSYKNYLEIGLLTGVNFRGINCLNKTGVDPASKYEDENVFIDTSDSFFDMKDLNEIPDFDIVFIDGDHTAEQVEKDIFNAWNSLTAKGVIVLHDINPPTEESQLVPKVSSPWKGTVWRAFVGFMAKHLEIKAYTTTDDTSLGFIWKSKHKVKFGFIDNETTYEEFDSKRKEMLRIQ